MAQQQKKQNRPKQPQDPYAQRTKQLTSAVQRLRGWVGSDPSRTPELADALVELTEHRLLGHGYQAAAPEAQESVKLAAQLLTANGPIGPYTAVADAARYVTAVVHLGVMQSAAGLPEAGAETVGSLTELRTELGSLPLVGALAPVTPILALSCTARGALVGGDLPQANAYADAALQRLAASGLRADPDAAYVVMDADRVISDARWAAGLTEDALTHLQLAREAYDRVVDGRLAQPGRLAPALLQRLTDPLFGLYRDLADRLVAVGEVDLGVVTRRQLVELLRGLAAKDDSARVQLAAALADLVRDLQGSDRTEEADLAAEELAGVPAADRRAASELAGGVARGSGGVHWTPLGEFEAYAGAAGATDAADLEAQLQLETAARLAAEREQARVLEQERHEEARIAAERREAERVEAERVAAERAEAARVEAERLATEQAEAARVEAERLAAEEEAERQERKRRREERIEAHRLEQERLAAERAEAERLALEEREAKRRAADPAERERLELEQLQAEIAELERAEAAAEADRLTAERLEFEHAQAERDEAERRAAADEAARIETERLEREHRAEERAAQERAKAEEWAARRAEKERLEAERGEAARAEAARIEAERVAQARRAEEGRAAEEEAARLEAERLEAERLERERAEDQRRAAEDELVRLELERIEGARLERERAERERVERERVERERERAEAAWYEGERRAREEAERARLEAEQAEAERAEAERAEAERAEAERLERVRAEAEWYEGERRAREEEARLAAERIEAERAEQARREAEESATRAEAERLAEQRREVQLPDDEQTLAPAEPAEAIVQSAEPPEPITHEPEQVTHEPVQPTAPAPGELDTTYREWQDAKGRGDRKTARALNERVVELLRPRAEQDLAEYGPRLLYALEELSSARLRSGELFASRAPAKEAKALAKSLGRR